MRAEEPVVIRRSLGPARHDDSGCCAWRAGPAVEISTIEVVAPNMLMNVLDRAIQCLGSLGVSDDTPVAAMWRYSRALRLADAPDEVHEMVIARRELHRFA